MSDQQGFAVPNVPSRKPTSDLPRIPPLNYEKPPWSGPPTYNYRLEVLKNGQSLETIDGSKNKEFVTIGRLPICDIPMEHPSISRYQAIIQFDQDGDAYLYDMDSAHGTRVNKKAIPGREYMPLKPGDQIRFGESTRLCIFDSEKPFDPEAEAEEQRRVALNQKIAEAQGEEATGRKDDEEDTGASWGFAEDAVEEENDDDDDEQDPEKQAAYIEANLNQSGDASLLNIEAEKMALEDAKRRREDLEIMYGDDSDEELYDKTNRKKKKVEKAATHDELVVKQKQTQQKIAQLQADLAEKKKHAATAAAGKEDKEEEDLDSFMQNLSKKPLNNDKSIFILQKELNQLKKDNERLLKLVKLTKPSHIL